MTNELDTSNWFDLKNYDKLNELDLAGWAELLAFRHHYYLLTNISKNATTLFTSDFEDEYLVDSLKNRSHWTLSDLDEFCFNIEDDLIDAVAYLKQGAVSLTPGIPKSPTWPAVCDLSELDVFNLALESGTSYEYPFNPNVNFSEMDKQPIGFNNENKVPVNINLNATDEQINIEFSRWLAGRRKAASIQSPKKLFTKADFDYWILYGVIPYLDLMLIAKIEGKKITQNKMANLIFPTEYNIDTTGRIRDTTKPEAERLITNEIHRSLSAQSVYKKWDEKRLKSS